ncbi:MAG TPA: glycosyltransferase family 2 protein [Candidatus Limnocylindria bacterium]|nr:glycosyltransferase family 2 protein [Candidatus Limnocylindria bacterium]
MTAGRPRVASHGEGRAPAPQDAAPQAAAARDAPATIVIPAFNEELGLARVLAELPAILDGRAEILVVDDGSTDLTGEVARHHGARVLRHERNRGKGAAVRTGMAAARGERIVVIDADGTYPVSAIPEMLARLDAHDLVVGVRRAGRDNIPPLNRLGNAAFRTLIRLSGFPSADPLTGLYGIQRRHLPRLRLRSEGFGIEAEIAMKSARLGLRSADVPLEYRPRLGTTKLRPVQDGLAIAVTIVREVLAGLLGRGPRRKRRPSQR